MGKGLCTVLKQFYDFTNRLSSSLYVTSNVYFIEVCKTERLLLDLLKSQDPLLIDMSKRMKEKFDKYWGNIDKMNMFLVFAVVLDPRYKFTYIRFFYSEIYDHEKATEILQRVKEKTQKVFKSYQNKYSPNEVKATSNEKSKVIHIERGKDAAYKRFLKNVGNTEAKNELE